MKIKKKEKWESECRVSPGEWFQEKEAASAVTGVVSGFNKHEGDQWEPGGEWRERRLER